MYDAASMQCIANGTCDGLHTGPTTTATGAIVSSPGAGGTPGVYVIELDLGLPGDSASLDPFVMADHLRAFATPLGPGILVSLTKCPVPGINGPFFLVGTTLAATGTLVDCPFDFIVFNVP